MLGERARAVLSLAAIAPYGADGLDWFAGMIPSAELRLLAGDSHFTIVTRAEAGLEWLRTRL